MSETILTSIKNPLVKSLRKLERASERRKQNLILLEGTNLLEAAYNANYPLQTVFCTEQWRSRHPQLWQTMVSYARQTKLASKEVISAIATTINPDGIVATAPKIETLSPPLARVKLGLVLETLQDPGNLGTIVRTAAATGVDSIWLSHDSVDLDNPKVLRASAGARFQVPISVNSNLLTLVENYRQQSGQIIATLPQAQKTYWEIDFSRPTLILLGNEGAGLSTQLANLADETVKIPLAEGVESLNVAIAAALLLYEAKRQVSKFLSL